MLRGASLIRQRTPSLPASLLMVAKAGEEEGLLQAEDAQPAAAEEGASRETPSPGLGPVLILAALFTTNQWARQLPFYTVDFKADAASAEAVRLFMNVDVGFDAAQ